MLKNTILSFRLAIENIRSNLFHTFLSVLGIVIGVAALVAILSLIDGLEQFAKGEITKTTSLNTIVISTEKFRSVGDVRVKKDSAAWLNYSAYAQLVRDLPNISKTGLATRFTTELQVDGAAAPAGAMLHAVTAEPLASTQLLSGRQLSADDVAQNRSVALINQDLVKQVFNHQRYAELPGKVLRFKGRAMTIAGVIKTPNQQPAPVVIIPITALKPTELQQYPPECSVEAVSVEHIAALKETIGARLKTLYPGKAADFILFTNEYRVTQTAQGFRMFRIVMGLIVGISILVGGIGVMNVLLIAVTERTTEIGIRKALGASRRAILRQFLAESITVSAFGSFLGLLVGVLATWVIVPVVKAITELPLQAVYTWNTFFVIAFIAIFVGIIFGTYPAVKAAKLDPVDAIRHE